MKGSDLLPVAHYAVSNRSPILKALFAVGCVLILAAIGFLGAGLTHFGSAAGMVGLFLVLYVRILPQQAIDKHMKSHAHVSEEGRYNFNAAQFTIDRPSLKLSMPWSAIHSVVEMKDVFAIFTTRNCFFAIPKRFFLTDEVTSFRELLEVVLRENRKPTLVFQKETPPPRELI